MRIHNETRCQPASRETFQDVCGLMKLGFGIDLSAVTHNPDFRYEDFMVVYAGHRPVASGCINHASCRLGPISLSVAPLGLVTTHPDERGKGYGLRLVQALLETAQSVGHDFSLVFPWKESWYAKAGFISVHSPYRRINLDTLQARKEHSEYLVRPFNPLRDVEALVVIHGHFAETLNGTLIRANPNWPLASFSRQTIMVAEKHGTVVAYGICSALNANNGQGDYGWKVREYGALPGHESALNAIFKAQGIHLVAGGHDWLHYESVHQVLPDSEPCRPPYRQVPGTDHQDAQIVVDQWMIQMYKMLNLNSVLQKLGALWDEQLQRDGLDWRDCFQLTSNPDEATGCYLIEFKQSGERIVLNEEELFTLVVFRSHSWWENRKTQRPGYTALEFAVIDKILAPHPFVYWDTDSF